MLSVFLVPTLVGAAGVVLSFQWGAQTPRGNTLYECGYAALGGGRREVPLNFFLVAILFLLFDVELLMLLPLVAAGLGQAAGALLFFFVVLTLGFWWEWRQGALRTTT